MPKKRPHTLETTLIALELIRRIPPHRKITAQELHKQLEDIGFERDIRSIQRLLDSLSLHFGIDRDDHKPYGYRWGDRRRQFSVPYLSEYESLLLALAEKHLRNLFPPKLMKYMSLFFEQARSNLDPASSSARHEREWMSKVRVVSTTQPLLPPKIDPKIFEKVGNALYYNHWLKVDYKNAEGKRIKADVMPLGLAQQGSRLYLVCRFEGFDNERSLALNRIIKAKATTLPFQRPRGFSLARYEEDGRFGFSESKRVRLSFRIKKDVGLHILESPLSKDQRVKEEGNYYKIAATVADTEQLKWWLRGFGRNVRDIRKRRVK